MNEAVFRSAGADFAYQLAAAEFEMQQQRRAFKEATVFRLAAARGECAALVEKCQGAQSGHVLQTREFVEKPGIEFARNLSRGEIEREQLPEQIAEDDLRAIRRKVHREYITGVLVFGDGRAVGAIPNANEAVEPAGREQLTVCGNRDPPDGAVMG